MKVRFLDVVVPFDDFITNLVWDNRIGVILLLIVLLLIAVFIVNRYILKKDKSEKVSETAEEDDGQ